MTDSSLRASIESIREFANNRKWNRLKDDPVNIEFIMFDVGQFFETNALVEAINYIETDLGIPLIIAGGGYSCIEVALHSNENDLPRLVKAVEDDIKLAQALNRAHVDLIKLHAPEGLCSYAAYYKMQLGICTNRILQRGRVSRDGVEDQFGEVLNESGGLNFGIAEVLILDRTENQSEDNLIRRVWRKVVSRNDFTSADDKVHVSGIRIVQDVEFGNAIIASEVKGFSTFLHGFANTFDDSLLAATLLAHRAHFRKIDTFPILFSWPSRGKVNKYLPDTNSAENSEKSLATYLEVVDQHRGDRAHSVIAHSHGAKVLVRAFIELSARHSKMRPIGRAIFVEGDVDNMFFIENANVLAKWTKSQVIYYSGKDRALLAANVVFESNRIGRNGLPESNGLKLDSMDLIDVTNVSHGLVNHAPHIESKEVIDDIHQCLMGVVAKKRLRLEPKIGQHNYWVVR
jgi:Alpha/beta hydrolase of unknown function (DUF900)